MRAVGRIALSCAIVLYNPLMIFESVTAFVSLLLVKSRYRCGGRAPDVGAWFDADVILDDVFG